MESKRLSSRRALDAAEAKAANMRECSVKLERNFLKLNNILRKTNTSKSTINSEAEKPPPQDVESMESSGSEYNSESECSESEYSDKRSTEKEINLRKQRKLDKEILSKKNKKSLVCKSCKEVFKLHSSLLKHERSHKSPNLLYKCTICKTTFKHRTSFTYHMKRLHPERECFPCEYPGCDSSFKTQKQKKDHNKLHYKYMCRFCKKGYARKAHMRLHVSEVH